MHPFIRTQYNFVPKREESGLECKDPSLAVQSSYEETDINVIVNRYMRSGVLPQIPLPPTQEEFAEIFDFRDAMDMINAADRSFRALPAEVRRRFGNDPHEFVNFCSDMDNLPELRKMGLALPPEPGNVPTPPTPETKA